MNFSYSCLLLPAQGRSKYQRVIFNFIATISAVGIAILTANSKIFDRGEEKEIAYLERCMSLFYIPATVSLMACLYGVGITDQVFDRLFGPVGPIYSPLSQSAL